MRALRYGRGLLAAPLAAVLVVVSACGNSASEAQTASGAAQAAASGGAPASGSDSAVVAVVNGEPITAEEIDRPIGGELARLAEEGYELRRRQLDEAIAARLVAAEAKRLGLAPEALLEREVKAKVQAVSDEDVAAFVAANRQRIQGDPAALAPRIKAYLQEQRVAAQRTAYVDGLRSRASVDVRLAPPPVYRAEVGTSGPSRGPASAPVTLVEFSDFHCPFCRSVQPTLNALLAKYPQQLRLVYRHLPLDGLHPQARRASEASWCADQQGKFWPYHDKLYASGNDARPETLRRLAGEVGLDLGKFDQCLAGGQAGAAVQADSDEGTRLGLTGTPGFFVNGRLLSGNQPLEAFVAVIEEELGAAR